METLSAGAGPETAEQSLQIKKSRENNFSVCAQRGVHGMDFDVKTSASVGKHLRAEHQRTLPNSGALPARPSPVISIRFCFFLLPERVLECVTLSPSAKTPSSEPLRAPSDHSIDCSDRAIPLRFNSCASSSSHFFLSSVFLRVCLHCPNARSGNLFSVCTSAYTTLFSIRRTRLVPDQVSGELERKQRDHITTSHSVVGAWIKSLPIIV